MDLHFPGPGPEPLAFEGSFHRRIESVDMQLLDSTAAVADQELGPVMGMIGMAMAADIGSQAFDPMHQPGSQQKLKRAVDRGRLGARRHPGDYVVSAKRLARAR